MAQIDTSIYRGMQGPSLAQGMASLAGGLGSIKQSKLADLAMKQQQFGYEQAIQNAQREEEERKRKQAQEAEFMAQYQTAQMEGGEQLTPEQIQGIYANVYPQQYAQQQVKSALSRDPYAGKRLELQEKEHKRKLGKDAESKRKFDERQMLDYKKFLQSGKKNEEQIRQYEQSMALKREEMDLELNKPERDRKFAQDGYRLQLPDHLQGKVKPSKIFVQGTAYTVQSSTFHSTLLVCED